jgi:hypothetical protein
VWGRFAEQKSYLAHVNQLVFYRFTTRLNRFSYSQNLAYSYRCGIATTIPEFAVTPSNETRLTLDCSKTPDSRQYGH